jgi:predicted permease
LPLDQLFAEILLIETATPLAVFSIILADIFKNDAAKTAGIVLLSTAISFATIPLWIFLAF